MNIPLACVVPAYKPDERISERVEALRAVGFPIVVLVDDGSGEEYSGVFAKAAAIGGCVQLRHERNQGKGAALKTAFAHVWEKCPELTGVVTVDADGQHAPEDCRRVADALIAEPGTLVLGTRDFRYSQVPFRSWWGNKWTSALFAVLYGRRVPDTQTGLRAFCRAWLPRLMSVPGCGYEYEMAMLCRAARAREPFRFVPIRTIYENNNSSSHFSPLRDTMRIYRMLFANIFTRL